VVAVDVDVVVDGPVVPVAKIINKIPTAHFVCSPISPLILTLIPPLSIPCFLFYLAHPPLPYSSLIFPTVYRLPLPKIIKKKSYCIPAQSPQSAFNLLLHPFLSITPPSPLLTSPHLHFSSLPFDTVLFLLSPTNRRSRPHKFSYVMSGSLQASTASSTSTRGSGVCPSTLWPGCKPVGSAEPHQGSGHVVGFSPAAGQSQHLKSAGVNFQQFQWLVNDIFAWELT